ncbi:MAG TPA: flagellar hook assembly protein FlgD [Rhizomicrobium sp.]|jgi:flagellar basal-body rod modification protein FlgD
MTSQIQGSGTQLQQSMSQLTGNFDTFLQLLTTQLQNQDPTSPMDSTQFTQQLVEFSQVEQQINTNANLQTLISLQEGGSGSASTSYLGKTVTIGNGNAALINSTANWDYKLASTAANVTLTVTDSSGNTVYSGAGTTNSGDNTFTWNGQDTNGNQLPDGTYTLGVNATDSSGNAITSTTTSTGVVSEIEFQNGAPVLMVGPMAVQLSQVQSIE